MFLFKAVGLIATICCLAWMYYFLVGCGPLLVLKHDVPQDSRVVRSFFDVHYRGVIGLASVAALAFLWGARPWLGLTFAGVAAYAAVVRKIIIPRMDQLHSTITPSIPATIRSFRRHHITGFLLNIAVIIALMIIISRPSAELFTCISVPPGCQADECRHQCSL